MSPSNDEATQVAVMPPVDYVSPLPPVRSGIADYSIDLLDAIEDLGAAERLRIVRVPGQDVAVEGVVSRFPLVEMEELGQDGRVPVYHVGNNTYHEAIYREALKRPGVVVLHDIFLHHLLQERHLARASLEGYLEELEHDYGWLGRVVAQPPRWSAYGQSALFALPAHRRLLLAQRGVVVHSEWARRFLLEESLPGELDAERVRVVPMVMPTPELSGDVEDRAMELRRSWGIPEGAFVLGTFGFQTPIKRSAAAVKALAEPGLEQVHLVVGGEVSTGLDLDGLAKRFGVEKRVHLVGFLEAKDFAAALRACSLFVNLRYPTAGETSASLLRILALGRAALVSDYAQFREAPDECCLRIPLSSDPGDLDRVDEEVVELGRRVAEMVEDPTRLDAMGRAARQHVASRHDPRLAARAFCAAVSDLAACPLPSEEPRKATAPIPTTLTWGRLESDLSVDGVDDWQPGELRKLEICLHNHSQCRFLATRRGVGGVTLEVRLEEVSEDTGSSPLHVPWLELPRDLDPGEQASWTVELRRPLGPGRLVVEPHVEGGSGFAASGGARWELTF